MLNPQEQHMWVTMMNPRLPGDGGNSSVLVKTSCFFFCALLVFWSSLSLWRTDISVALRYLQPCFSNALCLRSVYNQRPTVSSCPLMNVLYVTKNRQIMIEWVVCSTIAERDSVAVCGLRLLWEGALVFKRGHPSLFLLQSADFHSRMMPADTELPLPIHV